MTSPEVWHMWRAPRENRPQDLYRCHTKRRMGARVHAHPSLAWHRPFENIISRVKFWKVGVIPKEGPARPRKPILLLVWQRHLDLKICFLVTRGEICLSMRSSICLIQENVIFSLPYKKLFDFSNGFIEALQFYWEQTYCKTRKQQVVFLWKAVWDMHGRWCFANMMVFPIVKLHRGFKSLCSKAKWTSIQTLLINLRVWSLWSFDGKHHLLCMSRMAFHIF